MWTLWERRGPGRRWVVGALAAVMIIHNCGYIWTRKHRQFADRAMPTERLLEFARQTRGPVPVRCFPYPMVIAELALDIELGKQMEVVKNAEAGFCYVDTAKAVTQTAAQVLAD